jgi:hypothetical protein
MPVVVIRMKVKVAAQLMETKVLTEVLQFMMEEKLLVV